MSIALDLRCFAVLFVIPCAMVLSVQMGVGSWGCRNAISIWRWCSPYWIFSKAPPISDSAVDATTFLSSLLMTSIAPFKLGSLVF